MQKLWQNVGDAVMDAIFCRQDLAVTDNVYIRNGRGNNDGAQTYNTLILISIGTPTLNISTLIGSKMYFSDTTD